MQMKVVKTLVLLSLIGALGAGCGRSRPVVPAVSLKRETALSYNTSAGKGYSRRPSSVPALFDKKPWNNRLPFFKNPSMGTYTSDYGWRGVGRSKDFHGGVDVKVPAGTAVYALASGRVGLARSSGYNGGVILQDGSQSFSYWHLRPAVSKGSYIKAGDIVGHVASAGSRTHLDFKVHKLSRGSLSSRHDKTSIDPLKITGWPKVTWQD